MGPKTWVQIFVDPTYVAFVDVVQPEGAVPDDEEEVEVQVRLAAPQE